MIVPRTYAEGVVPANVTPDLLAALERAGFAVVPLEADDFVKGSMALESSRQGGERYRRVIERVRVQPPAR